MAVIGRLKVKDGFVESGKPLNLLVPTTKGH